MRILIFLCCLAPVFLSAQGSTTGWLDYSIGSPLLRMKLPGRPQAQEVNLPPGVLQRISKYEASYLKDDPKGVTMSIMHVVYAQDVAADKNGALEGTVGQWEATGSKVAILSTNQTEISGRSAVRQNGKLIMGGQEFDYTDR
jgi:hypothetical protein